jgi:hypothetical protein
MRYVLTTEYESYAAIGSNVFRRVKLKNQADHLSVRSEKQILFGRHRNQIAI